MIVGRVSSALQHSSHGSSDSEQVSDFEDNDGASLEDEESMEPM